MLSRLFACSVAAALLASQGIHAAPNLPAEPSIRTATGIVKISEFRLEGPLLASMKQRDPALEGINAVVLRRYAGAKGSAQVRGAAEAALTHYAAEMKRLGWYTLLTDESGRKLAGAYSSADGDWLFAVNVDSRGVVTSLVNGKISLEQMPHLERTMLKMLAAGPSGLPTAEDMEVLRKTDELIRAGKTADAETALAEGVKVSPQSVMLRRKLAALHREQKRRPEALAQLKAIVALEPAAYWARMDYARELYEIGDHQAAVFEFLQAGALSPDKGAPHYYAGRCYQAMGKPEQALVAYRAASQIAPHWSSVQIRMGEVYEAQGKLDRAAECFRQALRVAPKSSTAADALARVTGKQEEKR